MNIDVLKDLSPAEPASAGDLPPFGLFAAGVYPFLEFRWFHEAYYRVLEAFAAGRVRRLIVTMPPQHGKSVGASTLLPAYLLGRNPDLRIAIASYSASLASKFNRRVQRIIDSPEYAAFFPETTIKRGARPPEYLRTADEVEIIGHRGGLLSVGREGALTGNRVDCFILDDLYRAGSFRPVQGRFAPVPCRCRCTTIRCLSKSSVSLSVPFLSCEDGSPAPTGHGHPCRLPIVAVEHPGRHIVPHVIEGIVSYAQVEQV